MINPSTYKKYFSLLMIVVFTLVNLTVVGSAFCSMKDKSGCCCKQKTEKKSCCANKNTVKYVQHCVCEIKESKTDPAELSQSLNLNSAVKNIKLISTSETNISVKGILKEYINSQYNSFQSPPGEDINTLKCVLRI